MVKFVSNNLIEVNRELSALDKFALEFTKILKKYSKYVIVSGYVSILLGRARVSEDIDLIIPKMDTAKFLKLFDDLSKSNFYCLNAEDKEEVYSYLNDSFAVRFAKKNTVIPNVELKFSKNKIDDISLSETITVKINNKEIVISSLELQIAFKEKVLKSPKDIEDARHVRNVAEGHINKSKIREYEDMLDDFQ